MSSSGTELRAQVNLLKACMTTKANLNYEISQIKIANSYRQSNSDFRDSKDMGNQTKVLAKRLNDVKALKSAKCVEEVKVFTIDAISDLVHELTETAKDRKEIEELEAKNDEIQTYVNELKEKYMLLQEEFVGKLETYERNAGIVEYYQESNDVIAKLQTEIGEYKERITKIIAESKEMQDVLKRSGSRRTSYVDKIKIYHKLSEIALQFRSKLLLRAELMKNIKNAEVEMEILTMKIEAERTRIEAMEKGNEQGLKAFVKLELDYFESKKELKNLEGRVDDLVREKQRLLELTQTDFRTKKKQDVLYEGDTLSLEGAADLSGEVLMEKPPLGKNSNRSMARIRNKDYR